MRLLLTIIIILHGLVHLLGFVKAYGLMEIRELTQPVSKPVGIIWLMGCLLFILTGIQYLLKNEYWWATAFIALLVSQSLILFFWQDAKFGTIPNIIILIVSVIGFGHFDFNRRVHNEINHLLSYQTEQEKSIITPQMMEHLPEPIAKWLNNAGIMGKEAIHTVYLKQHAWMKMKPKQEQWSKATAEQYFTIKEPSFIWTVDMQIVPLVDVVGRDKFEDGKGAMLIKILSLIPVVNTQNSEKINTGTLQRYLGEIVWFPSAALSPYITWEEIDAHSAKATMTWQGTTGEGIFYFDQAGNFKKYSAMRYMGGEEDAPLKEWVIEVNESKRMHGINIPVKISATWKLDEGDWTWLQLELTEINYNISEP